MSESCLGKKSKVTALHREICYYVWLLLGLQPRGFVVDLVHQVHVRDVGRFLGVAQALLNLLISVKRDPKVGHAQHQRGDDQQEEEQRGAVGTPAAPLLCPLRLASLASVVVFGHYH